MKRNVIIEKQERKTETEVPEKSGEKYQEMKKTVEKLKQLSFFPVHQEGN